MPDSAPAPYRNDLLEIAAAYASESILVTTSNLDLPGPQILYVNSAFSRMTGYSISELLGKTPRVLQGPKTDRATLQQLRQELTAGRDFIARTVNYKHDGSEFEIEWIISHLRDSAGRTSHYVAIQRDITGIERAEHRLTHFDDELREASRRLQETVRQLEKAEQQLIGRHRLAALGRMAAGVAHDLSNAIQPIQHYAEVLQGAGLPAHAEESVQGILRGAAHASQLLANLKLLYSRGPSSGRQPLQLKELLQRIPELTRFYLDDRRRRGLIEVQLDLEDTPPVVANSTELTQVLVNLTLNAVDAMPEGGTHTLSLRQEQGQAVVQVTDTGHGLSDEMLEHCFEPFVSTKSEGSGLGLNVCQLIVAGHGGTIRAGNRPEGGAVFTIRLPLAGQRQDPPHAAPRRLRILHLAADAEERQRMRQLLGELGHDVTSTANGDECLAEFYEQQPDIVLVGAEPSSTSGLDVAHAVKRARPAARLAVIGDPSQLAFEPCPEHLAPDAVLPPPRTVDDIERLLAALEASTQD